MRFITHAMILIHFDNIRRRLLNLFLFLSSDEITDLDQMNAMDQILAVNSSK